ncbi:hypothetical protein EV126DRAFT_160552 [Verticillium dahliae]|nr:hypothetical protein EV126DRAFT_160552 [Verticillium dahliae]
MEKQPGHERQVQGRRRDRRQVSMRRGCKVLNSAAGCAWRYLGLLSCHVPFLPLLYQVLKMACTERGWRKTGGAERVIAFRHPELRRLQESRSSPFPNVLLRRRGVARGGSSRVPMAGTVGSTALRKGTSMLSSFRPCWAHCPASWGLWKVIDVSLQVPSPSRSLTIAWMYCC